MIEWIIKNKDWIFSGIGVALLTALFSWRFKFINKKRHSQPFGVRLKTLRTRNLTISDIESSGSGFEGKNISANGDVRINSIKAGIKDYSKKSAGISLPTFLKNINVGHDLTIQSIFSPPIISKSNIPPQQASYYVRRSVVDDVKKCLLNNELTCIVGVRGEGGVGKSELARVLAKEIQSFFDFVVWVSVQDNSPFDILFQLAEPIGLSITTSNIKELSYLVKRAYSSYNSLIILDDVRLSGLDYLYMYIMPQPSSTLITSRIQNIPNIPATNIHRVGRLSNEEARLLLSKVLGRDVVTSEQKEVDKIISLCGSLPLALDIIVRKMKNLQLDNIDLVVTKTLENLKTTTLRYSTLGQVYAAFRLSYNQLPFQSQRFLDQLSVFHESGFSIEACSHLWEQDLSNTRVKLEGFADISLIQRLQKDRYRLHDFLYEILLKEIKSENKNNACHRHVIFFYQFVKENAKNNTEAHAILDSEINHIILSTKYMINLKLDDELCDLTELLHNNSSYLNTRGRYNTSIELLQNAIKVINLNQNKTEQRISFLQSLGDTYRDIGLYEKALKVLDESLEISENNNYLSAQCHALRSIGVVQNDLKNYDNAILHYRRAIDLASKIKDRYLESRCIGNIGISLKNKGELKEAIRCQERALEISRNLGDRRQEGRTLGNLGIAYSDTGEKIKAIKYYKKALEIANEISDIRQEGIWLANIGFDYIDLEEKELAKKYINKAIGIFEKIGTLHYINYCKEKLKKIE